MRLLRLLFRGAGPRDLAGVLAALLGGIASTAALAAIPPAIERAGGSPAALSVFVAAIVASVAFNIMAEQLASVRAQDLLLQLRMSLARQVLATPLRRVEEIGAGPLLAVLTEDAAAIANALPGLAQLCPQLAIVAACMAYMMWLAPWGFVVVLALTLVGVCLYALPNHAAVKALRAARINSDHLLTQFRALVDGIKQLQVHQGRSESFLDRCLEDTARSARRNALRAFRLYLTGTNLGRAFFLIAILSVLVLAPVFGAPRRVTVGLSMTILYLTRPLEVILSWLPVIGRAGVSAARLEDLGMVLAGASPAGPVPCQPSTRRIELNACTYEHRSASGDRFVLGPVNLELLPGRITFVTGGNGAGKTTLTKMVVGLLDPTAGRILVDGHPVSDRDGYRALFSVVFADSFPYPEFKLPGELDDRERLLLAHGMDPGLFEDLVEKPSHVLSHGQRKRLLLLSALAEDRPFYVFDEWAAEQDPVFKQLFYDVVLPALRARNKAILVISHDDAYFRLADQRLRLECGALARAEGDIRSPVTPARSRTIGAS